MMKTPDINTGLLTLTLLALAVAGCAGADGSDGTATATDEDGVARRSVRIETLVLQPTTFEDVIELTGTVESLNDATLSAQSAGTVEYLAPLGLRVAQGAVIARIDQGLVKAGLQQTEAQVENAQASLELAQDNYNRQEPLYRDSIISALEFQNVRAQLNQAQAALRQADALRTQAQEQLDNTVIRAPSSGTVEAHAVERGEQVTPGMPVIRVVDVQRVKVTVGVPERYAGDIEVGTPVQLDFRAYRGQVRQGRVTFAGNAINPMNRTFPVEIEVDNAGSKLKPEMIVEVYISRERLDEVLVVPRAAVLRDEQGTSVFVVSQQDGVPTASRLAVTLGAAYAGSTIIESGLEAGAEVIILGQTTVTEGDAVEIVERYTRLDEAGIPVK
ncbi:MAG: efflux RND transporter periplasmic adaptor subunit [Bacteroidetes bacterium]|nr:efflux RND transporter periplasmic adaptor subunit [Bacteroidota bacterium]